MAQRLGLVAEHCALAAGVGCGLVSSIACYDRAAMTAQKMQTGQASHTNGPPTKMRRSVATTIITNPPNAVL